MTVRLFYRLVVWSFLAFVALVGAMNIVLVIVGNTGIENLNNNMPFIVRLPLGMFGAFLAVGMIALWVGMMWNSLVVSKLPVLSKVGWFLLMVITNMLGALIYYFVVFQKQETQRVRDVLAHDS
jgi:hypothetical protein